MEKVYTDENEIRIEIIKTKLQEMGINSVLINKKISGYGIGKIELMVTKEDAIEAKKIIKELNIER